MKSLISIFWITIILLMFTAANAVFNTDVDNTEKEEKIEGAFCGTVGNMDHSPKYTEGRNLFYSNCASCHNRNMTSDMTGPALAGFEERWARSS